MNRFADYFSNYVNDDTITYIGNGDISSFTVSRQNRELTVGVSFDSFVDYAVIDNAQNQIAQAMELKKVHIFCLKLHGQPFVIQEHLYRLFLSKG